MEGFLGVARAQAGELVLEVEDLGERAKLSSVHDRSSGGEPAPQRPPRRRLVRSELEVVDVVFVEDLRRAGRRPGRVENADS